MSTFMLDSTVTTRANFMKVLNINEDFRIWIQFKVICPYTLNRVGMAGVVECERELHEIMAMWKSGQK